MITSSVLAGGVAGAALVILDATLGDEMDRIDSGAAALAAVGLALTVVSAQTGDEQSRALTSYWVIVAVASIPVVVQHWLRRDSGIRRMGRRIAERDYRGNAGAAA